MADNLICARFDGFVRPIYDRKFTFSKEFYRFPDFFEHCRRIYVKRRALYTQSLSAPAIFGC